MNCILCGKCMEVCPLLRATSREELSPRAKADLATILQDEDNFLLGEDVARLAGLCLGCGRCRDKCPQGVDVPALVAGLRAAHPDFRGWLWKTWLKRARELWPSSSLAARLIPEKFQPDRLTPFLKALALLRSGPAIAPFVAVEKLPETYKDEPMLLFSGCTARYVQGVWRERAEKLLHAMGVKVIESSFECCGLGLESAGFGQDARAMHERNVQIWRTAGKPRIVTFCASCHNGLRRHADCLEGDEEIRAWAESLTPLAALLRGGEYVLTESAPLRIGYHRPCHIDKVDEDHMLLAALLAGQFLRPDGRECCGFGGIMQLGAPELSSQVNHRCWLSLQEAEIVLTGCSACVAQLGATAPDTMAVGHWLEMFDLSW